MSRIFDNIEKDLLEALRDTLAVSRRADFCIGYLNLRGWQALDERINQWAPEAGQVNAMVFDPLSNRLCV